MLFRSAHFRHFRSCTTEARESQQSAVTVTVTTAASAADVFLALTGFLIATAFTDNLVQ